MKSSRRIKYFFCESLSHKIKTILASVMEVVSLLEEIKDTFAEENFTKQGLKDPSVSAKLVSGLERR